MSDLTREQIEEVREMPAYGYNDRKVRALCDMALRTLDAEARIRELKGANERLRTAANVGRDRIENMAQLESDYGESEELFECVAQIDACIAAAPPDSGSADEVLDE